MIIEKFFPTIVYGKDVELDNKQLAQDITNWSNQDKGVEKTNYKGWHSKTDMATKPEYQLLITELMRMQQEIYKHEHLDRCSRLGNMWDLRYMIQDQVHNLICLQENQVIQVEIYGEMQILNQFQVEL